MAADEDKSNDFYAVMGLKKECTDAELRNAYKKLALVRILRTTLLNGILIASLLPGIPSMWKRQRKNFKPFNKPIQGMGDFLNEMAAMMSQTKSDENGNETFEELQELFDEMFQDDFEAFGSSSRSATPPTCSSSSSASCSETYSISNKRNSSEMSCNNLRAKAGPFEGFCIGTGGMSGKHQGGGESSRRKNTRKCRR
ncbi:UNVERIFIED_CONTAM: hypothetical protein Scaly_1842900 [Sesamum calycinum]|uniref:J domain-containing protein n=1 Tax=Sesamum calycinum TaxID=2727403 RepID=A0AAW2NF08_9LAMI